MSWVNTEMGNLLQV